MEIQENNENQNFHVNAKQFSITVPKFARELVDNSELAKQHFDEFKKRGTIEHFLQCQERHQDGSIHLHLAIRFTKKVHIRDWAVFSTLVFGKNSFFQSLRTQLDYLKWARYCKKDGDFTELGQKLDTSEKTNTKKLFYESAEKKEDFKTLIEKDPTKEIAFNIVKNKLNFNQLTQELYPPKDIFTTRGFWIHGEPGTGKSKLTRLAFPATEILLKDPNSKWFPQLPLPVMLIEDIDPRCFVTNPSLTSQLKYWADEYQFPAECKGGLFNYSPSIVIVTSNYALADCVPGGDEQGILQPIRRRFREFSLMKKPDGQIDKEKQKKIIEVLQEFKKLVEDSTIPDEEKKSDYLVDIPANDNQL